MTGRLTHGVHHVGLTVPGVDQARAFFCGTLGFDEVGGVPDYPSLFVSDGTILLTLWRAADPLTARAFDRRVNIGLHHLSLSVADDAALQAAWDTVTAHPEVVVDAAPGPILPGSSTRHFLIFIPGGIRMEFRHPHWLKGPARCRDRRSRPLPMKPRCRRSVPPKMAGTAVIPRA